MQIYSHRNVIKLLPILVFLFALFLFSFWLMFHTLSYAASTHSILVASKYWSDFGNSLPLIRSFSFGSNWPLQHPLYPGVPIRYHFLFYALVGLLEKTGLRFDWALNLPSALGFFSLCLMIFALAKRIFFKTSIAVLSVFFFLFNGSLSFLDFLSAHPLSLATPAQVFSNSVFPSFGPWNGSLIAAFWNLNIYTNQRHLALSFAVVLVIIYILYSSKAKFAYLTGFLTGLLLLLNQAAFALVLPFLVIFFLFRPALRLPLLLSLLGFFPWFIFTRVFTTTSPDISFKPLFLFNAPLTLLSVIRYWFYNFGFHLFLIPLGLLLAPRRAKIFFVPLLALFLLPNLYQFSVDMINNHKFFNFYLILGSMFSAFLVVWLWSKLHLFGKLLAPLLFLALIMGGLVDFFPVANDHSYALSDYPANPDVSFFVDHTPRNAVVLNSTWFYHPASLAGRPIFNGYSYFTWSVGYDQTLREFQTLAIYQAPSKLIACDLLRQHHISYVELNLHPENFIHPNWSLWQQDFHPVYFNPSSDVTVYDVKSSCQ